MSGDPGKGPGQIGGTLEELRDGTGWGTLGEVRDGSEDSPECLERVGKTFQRTWTIPRTLPEVRDG